MGRIIRRMTNTEQVNDRKARASVGASGIIMGSVGNVEGRFSRWHLLIWTIITLDNAEAVSARRQSKRLELLIAHGRNVSPFQKFTFA